ncbi:MAG: sensor histidine kinase [Bacteroidota bacterium]
MNLQSLIKKHHILCLLVFVLGQNLQGQNTRKIDSLQKELQKQLTNFSTKSTNLADTLPTKTYYALAKELLDFEPERAETYLLEGLKICEQLHFTRGLASFNHELGVYAINSGEYERALKYLNESIIHFEANGDKVNAAINYGNIAIVYDLKGNQPEALKIQLKALNLFKELKRDDGIAFSLNNIGIIYEIQKKYDKAKNYYFEALAIRKKQNDAKGLGDVYGNIGNLYNCLKLNDEALRYHQLGLEAKRKAADPYGISDALHNMANLYVIKGELDKALKMELEAVSIKEKLGNNDMLESSYSNIGFIFIKKHQLEKAKSYLQKAFEIATQVPSHELKQDCYLNMSLLDSAMGNYPAALKHYKLHILYRDSLLNEENTEKILQQQIQYDYDLKEAKLRAEQDKKDNINQAEMAAHKTERILYIILALILIFAVFVLWSRLNLSSKTRLLLEEKNKQIQLAQQWAEEERSKAELMQVRNKIAKDLHDDIGSSLSSIAIYGELAQKIISEKMPEAKKILSNLEEIALEAMENMNDIVWAINPVNDKLEDIMSRVSLLAERLHESTQIEIHFEVPADVKQLKLNMQQRKNIYLIFKEALNNITKYAGAKNCYMRFKNLNGKLLISIKDDGIGFDELPESFGGNGLMNMRARVKEINGQIEIISAKGKGTEIKFEF